MAWTPPSRRRGGATPSHDMPETNEGEVEDMSSLHTIAQRGKLGLVIVELARDELLLQFECC